VSLAWCHICPDDLVVDGESGHMGTVIELKGEYALVEVALLGRHWILADDLELAARA
jgi:hypothetical protein